MAKTKSKYSNIFKKPVFIVAAVLVVTLVAGVLVFRDRQSGNPGGEPETVATDGSYVNLNPPTEQELSDTEKHKDDLMKQSEQSDSSGGSNKVTPVITNATAQQINAFVPGVFEEGGTCKATLTKGSEVVTKTSAGFQNVSYTSCVPIDVAGSLGAGTWSVVVSYSSSSASGQSETKTFAVD